MKKCVILLSGGIDSTVATWLLSQKGFQIYPLLINYYHKAYNNELKSASFVSKYFKTEKLKIVDSNVYESVYNPLLYNAEIKQFLNANNITSNNYLPFRNLLFSILGSLYCKEVGAETLAFGFIKKENWAKFPDTSPGFLERINKLYNVIDEQILKIEVQSPTIEYFKWELIQIAFENNLPIQKTYSCYENKRCGKCESCKDALLAFEIASRAINSEKLKLLNPYLVAMEKKHD